MILLLQWHLILVGGGGVEWRYRVEIQFCQNLSQYHWKFFKHVWKLLRVWAFPVEKWCPLQRESHLWLHKNIGLYTIIVFWSILPLPSAHYMYSNEWCLLLHLECAQDLWTSFRKQMLRLFRREVGEDSPKHEEDQGYWWFSYLVKTLYTLTLVCRFSILFSIHFSRCWQGEFLQ